MFHRYTVVLWLRMCLFSEFKLSELLSSIRLLPDCCVRYKPLVMLIALLLFSCRVSPSNLSFSAGVLQANCAL